MYLSCIIYLHVHNHLLSHKYILGYATWAKVSPLWKKIEAINSLSKAFFPFQFYLLGCLSILVYMFLCYSSLVLISLYFYAAFWVNFVYMKYNTYILEI